MNNQDSKCPCIDCITFSICKAEISEKGDLSIFYTLKPKCEILEDYLKVYENAYSTKKCYKVLSLFGIEETINWRKQKKEIK